MRAQEVLSPRACGGFVAALVTVLASACNGGTEPLQITPPITFDVTASFTQFSFETPSPSPPECPNLYNTYCTHGRPFTGATLSGTLVLDATASPTTRLTAQMARTFCNRWSVDAPTRCLSVKDMPLHEYHEDRFETRPRIGQVILEQGDNFTPTIVLSYASPLETADTLRGLISFMEYQYRSPPTHIGTYVAVRLRCP